MNKPTPLTSPVICRDRDMDTYRIRADHEWATICIFSGQRATQSGQTNFTGEILIHSSFGNWANYWGALGSPFREFLAGKAPADMHYMADKLLADKSRVFSGEATLKNFRQSLLEHRGNGEITKSDARTIWTALEENSDALQASPDEFVKGIDDIIESAGWKENGDQYGEFGPGRGARDLLVAPWERIRKEIEPAFQQFWKTLWPVLTGALREEIAQQVAEAAAVDNAPSHLATPDYSRDRGG